MTSPADGEPPAEPRPATGGSGSSTTAGAHSGPAASGAVHHPQRPGSGTAQIIAGDWPAQAADRIVDLVDTVRDKTTGPVQKAARAAVYGLIGVILGIVVVVLIIILLIRLLDILVDKFVPWGGIWLPYLIVGAILIAVGSFFFRRRRASAV
jgi:hypothetical protein